MSAETRPGRFAWFLKKRLHQTDRLVRLWREGMSHVEGEETMRDSVMPVRPEEIAATGEKIYETRYRAEFEIRHPGKFVAINVIDESTTIGDTASQALFTAKKDHPEGMFHLIRIGHPGAFEVGIAYRNARPNWIHR